MAEANKTYKYLVVKHWSDDEPEDFSSALMSAAEIFNEMDMSDCFPCELELGIYRIEGIGLAPVECSFRGKWHDSKDPLKMAIVGGGIREVGYGTDH